MKPMASFGPTVSIILSPIVISSTPDCTMYMQLPASPWLNTTAPAPKLMVAPTLRANCRMSMSLFTIFQLQKEISPA